MTLHSLVECGNHLETTPSLLTGRYANPNLRIGICIKHGKPSHSVWIRLLGALSAFMPILTDDMEPITSILMQPRSPASPIHFLSEH